MPLSNAGHVRTVVGGQTQCPPLADTGRPYEVASARPATNPLDQAH